jgi:RNA polymerase sigma-70 factor (ECF subfamily)
MSSNLHPSDGPDEAALVRLAGSGDSEAFGVLYVRYMDPIFRYVYFRVGEQAEAEDLTDEVFVRAGRRCPSTSRVSILSRAGSIALLTIW